MMQPTFDLSGYKNRIRRRYKGIRAAMDPRKKAEKDSRIRKRLCGLSAYKAAGTILCFVSTPSEIDTHEFIRIALAQGKTVAVPYCVAGTRDMEFYRINSLKELQLRTFGIMEPIPSPENKIDAFADSICILPGLVFDSRGHRLGYGAGYYDRFLAGRYSGIVVGICYAQCVKKHLPTDQNDIPCDWLVTEWRAFPV